MKKTAVVYFSKHGATAKYAGWIARETGADLFNGHDIRRKDLQDYEIIVFGGGIYGGGIQGIDFIRKGIRNVFRDKLILCFAVGISVQEEANRKQANSINFTKKMEDIPCWYLPGAYDPSAVKGLDKRLMAITRKMLENGGGSSAFGNTLKGYIDDGCDLVDQKYIRPICGAIIRAQRGEPVLGGNGSVPGPDDLEDQDAQEASSSSGGDQPEV